MSTEQKKSPEPQAAQSNLMTKDDAIKLAQQMAKEMIAEVIPAIAVSLAQANKAAAPKAKERKPGCQVCRQEQMACSGKHRKMVVLPHVNAEWFPGVKLNGVTYISSGGELIDVPADCNFEYMLAQWDMNETHLMRGKKKFKRMGSVGNSGRAVAPLSAEDFFR